MSRVITFSRTFPATHTRAGMPTFFVEKLLNCIGVNYNKPEYIEKLIKLNPGIDPGEIRRFYVTLRYLDIKKSHTIRGSMRFKKGDLFSPRVWSGSPYNSKQIILHEDIEVANIWPFSISKNGTLKSKMKELTGDEVNKISLNDGLLYSDFISWFIPNQNNIKPFDGQIICWDPKVEY